MDFAWVRKPGVQKAMRVGGYVAFGTVVFLVSVVLTFPTGRLRSYLEGRLSRDGITVRIEDLSLRGLGSAALFGVKVDLPPTRYVAPDGTVTEEARSVALDRLDVSVGLFRLLLGGLKVSAKAYSGDGVLGPVTVLKTAEQVTVDLEGAKDFPLPSDLPVFGVRFGGKLTALAGQVTYDVKGGLAASKARIEVKAEGLKALKPTLRSATQGTVSLSDADLGNLVLDVNLDKRSNLAAFKGDRKAPGGDGTVLHVEKAELDGQDIKALVEGHSVVRLSPGKPFGEGQLTVEIAFSIADAFFDRQVKTGAEVGTPNRFLRTLLSMDPKWRNAQSGSYWGVMCSGSVERPSCIPKKPIVRGGDFKAPAKATEDKGEPKDAKAGSSPRPPQPPPAATPSSPASAPAAPPPRVESPPPYTPPPVEPDDEASAAEKSSRGGMAPNLSGAGSAGAAAAGAAAGAVRGMDTLKPTVIGRARIRGLTPAGGEGEESPGPTGEPPPGEGAAVPSVAPPPGDGEE